MNDATGFYLLRLSKPVAQRKDRRQKYHERQNNLTESIADAAMACSVKGVGATRIWYPRPSRPSPHDLLSCFPSIWRRTKGGPTPGGPAGRSFDAAKGKERPPRGSRCRFIKMVNHAKPWALVARRPCGAHPCFFAIARPAGSSAMCQPQDHG
jgi:hypothetical protein